MMKHDIAAVPWYVSQQHYQQFRASAQDGDDFFESFSDWLAAAMEHERQAERNGITIIRIRMDFAEFQLWCSQQGFANCSQSRSEFAEMRAHQFLDWKST